MSFTSGNYKTIKYKLSKNGRKLIVVLPKAGAKFTTHKKLLEELREFGSVLFVERGYFGLSKANDNSDKLQISSFYAVLNVLVKKLRYKEIVILAESVGAIHALKYASEFPQKVERLILCNPALYNRKLYHKFFLLPILYLGLKLSPDKVLFSVVRLLKKIPSQKTKLLAGTFLKMNRTIGAKSFLLCLEEIVKFNSYYIDNKVSSLLSRTAVLKGEKDFIFDLLCNTKYCKTSSYYINIPNIGHGILDVCPSEVIKILRSK